MGHLRGHRVQLAHALGIPMSSHFTEQSKVAMARKLACSKKSKIRAPSTRPPPTALYRRAGSKRGEDFLQLDKGRGNTTLSICKLRILARLLGRSVWMGMLQLVPKLAGSAGWERGCKARASRKTLHGHLLGKPLRRCALLDAGFLSLPCTMHSLHPSAQLPGKSRHQRHESVTLQWSPCPARMYNLPGGQVTSEKAAGVGLCAACIIRAWLSEPVEGITSRIAIACPETTPPPRFSPLDSTAQRGASPIAEIQDPWLTRSVTTQYQDQRSGENFSSRNRRRTSDRRPSSLCFYTSTSQRGMERIEDVEATKFCGGANGTLKPARP